MGVLDKLESKPWIGAVFGLEGAHGFDSAPLGIDELVNRDDAPLAPGALQHAVEGIYEWAVDVENGNVLLPGRKCQIDQPGSNDSDRSFPRGLADILISPDRRACIAPAASQFPKPTQ